jgi:signal transduction histidine kinase
VQVDNEGRNPPPAATAGAGTGIAGMRERAGALGGRLEAGPRPGGGFRVRARFPLDAPS